jgi:hypothetical protein
MLATFISVNGLTKSLVKGVDRASPAARACASGSRDRSGFGFVLFGSLDRHFDPLSVGRNVSCSDHLASGFILLMCHLVHLPVNVRWARRARSFSFWIFT